MHLELINAHEYGFYSNVNPTVDHPRWSQAKETRLPGYFKNTPTLMLTGMRIKSRACTPGWT